MKILADSGILLRLPDPAEPLRPIIEASLNSYRNQGDEFLTATQNLAEFWNVCTRPATVRGGLGLTIPQTEHRLLFVEKTFSVIVELTTTYPNWRSLVVAHAVKGKQVHDARLVALMQSHGIAHIMTLNGSDFTRYPGITVIDPTKP